MDDKRMRDKVHAAVAQHCRAGGVQTDPCLARRVLAASREERGSALRGKRSLMLLIALVCMLLSAAVGLAMSLSREYFREIAAITLSSGDYESWSLEEKRYMLTIMAKYGLLPEKEAQRLSRRSEAEIDAFMLDRYAFESAPDDLGNISLTRIAWVEMGPYTDWDNETWVWYSHMMFEVGLWTEHNDVDVYETPGEEAVSPEEAVRIAEEYLVSQGYDRGAVEGSWRVWHYMTHASDVNREDMVYCITFRFADGSEAYVNLRPDGMLR